MTSLGIDPGFGVGKGTMVCVHDSIAGIYFARICPGDKDLLARFRAIRDDVAACIAARRHERVVAAIESPTRILGSQRNAIGLLWLLYDALAGACELWEVPTATVKRFATAKGNADKAEIATACMARWGKLLAGRVTLNEDEADGLVLNRIADCLAGGAGYTKDQQAAVLKCRRVGH